MKKALKRVLVLLGVVLLVAVGFGGWAHFATASKLDRTWPVEGKSFPIPFPLTEEELAEARHESGDDVDAAALALERAVARGEHLAQVRLGCTDCHAEDMAGGVVVDAPVLWTWIAPNITRGGVTADYEAADWDRIIRHGIRKDGRTATMPAIDYVGLSDREVSDIAAYVWSLPASDREMPQTELGPMGTVLLALGKLPLAAERIDHDAVQAERPPEAEVSVAYGEHVAQTCVGCHGMSLTGGPIHGGDPSWPEAANLTPHDSGLAGWTEDDFVRSMREGVRPDGSAVDPVMPWKTFARMTDVELRAAWVYLSSLEPRPKGAK